MASNEERELANLLGSENQGAIFALTISSFLKFQLKRKPLRQDGTSSFLKQSRGIVAKQKKMDEVSASAIRYARHELENDEVFQKNFDEEARAIVLEDLVKALKLLTDELLAVACED